MRGGHNLILAPEREELKARGNGDKNEIAVFTIAALLILLFGPMAVFRPRFFFDDQKLSKKQINKNLLRWRRGGIALTVMGVAALILEFIAHRTGQ
jgi:membrane protease YdiL (CAAX protease family)